MTAMIKNQQPVFFKGKWLTPYAFSCGYVHSQYDGDVKLYNNGYGFEIVVGKSYLQHMCYTRYIRERYIGLPVSEDGINAFYSYKTIGEARKAFKTICGKLEERFESECGVRRMVYR